MREIFNSARDLEHHMGFHFENPINPFQNNQPEGEIGRRTPHGFGIPPEGLRAFREKILFDRTNMTWNCALCNFSRNGYQRKQVFGNVRAQRCYTSRKSNERWNIPIGEQYHDPYNQQLPKNIEPLTEFALNIGHVVYYKPTPDTELWECTFCNARKEKFETYSYISQKNAYQSCKIRCNMPILPIQLS